MAPAPLTLREWLADHAVSLSAGAHLDPFEGVRSDMYVCVHGGPSHIARQSSQTEVWLCQIEGEAHLYSQIDDERLRLTSGDSLIVPAETPFSMELGRGAIALTVGLTRLPEVERP